MDLMDYTYKTDKLDIDVSASPPSKDDPLAVQDGYVLWKVNMMCYRWYKCWKKTETKSENYPPNPANFNFQILDYNITQEDMENGSKDVVVQPDRKGLKATVYATSRGCYFDMGQSCGKDGYDTLFIDQNTKENATYSGHARLSLDINLRSDEMDRKIGHQTLLLVTTRGVCCCPQHQILPKALKEGIVTAHFLDNLIESKGSAFGLNRSLDKPGFTHLDKNKKISKSEKDIESTGLQDVSERDPRNMLPQEANALASLVRSVMIESTAPGLGSPKEPIPYMQHDLFFDKLEARLRPYKRIREHGEKLIAKYLDSETDRNKVERYFGRPIGKITCSDVARIPASDLSRVTGFDRSKSVSIRLKALGIPLKQDIAPEEKAAN
jgi:hypothetical protein